MLFHTIVTYFLDASVGVLSLSTLLGYDAQWSTKDAPHDHRLKGLSQLNVGLSHSKSATYKTVSQNNTMQYTIRLMKKTPADTAATPMVTRSYVGDGSLNEITPCPMTHAKTPVHYQGMP